MIKLSNVFVNSVMHVLFSVVVRVAVRVLLLLHVLLGCLNELHVVELVGGATSLIEGIARGVAAVAELLGLGIPLAQRGRLPHVVEARLLAAAVGLGCYGLFNL